MRLVGIPTKSMILLSFFIRAGVGCKITETPHLQGHSTEHRGALPRHTTLSSLLRLSIPSTAGPCTVAAGPCTYCCPGSGVWRKHLEQETRGWIWIKQELLLCKGPALFRTSLFLYLATSAQNETCPTRGRGVGTAATPV